jgi:Transposase IS116/IS110/IS902 family/Transposase
MQGQTIKRLGVQKYVGRVKEYGRNERRHSSFYIGSEFHWVSVPKDRASESVKRFGCYTADLYALADWLAVCGVKTVAMESTGVYWIALFQILETRGFEVKLVNAHHVKTLPGRKTDILDCQFSDKVNPDESPLPQPKNPRNKPQGNEPAFDLRTHLYRISSVDFTAIDGLGILTVQTIISEVGLDPSRFPTVKHFTSWLGLCPCNRITGGKVKSSRTRLVVNPAANAFRMAAQTAGKSNSAESCFLPSFTFSPRYTQSYHCYCS